MNMNLLNCTRVCWKVMALCVPGACLRNVHIVELYAFRSGYDVAIYDENDAIRMITAPSNA